MEDKNTYAGPTPAPPTAHGIKERFSPLALAQRQEARQTLVDFIAVLKENRQFISNEDLELAQATLDEFDRIVNATQAHRECLTKYMEMIVAHPALVPYFPELSTYFAERVMQIEKELNALLS